MSSVAFVPKFLRCNVTQYPIIYIYELRDQNSRKGAKKQRLLGDELRLSISFPNSNGDVDGDSYSRYLSCGVKFKCEPNFALNGIQSSKFWQFVPTAQHLHQSVWVLQYDILPQMSPQLLD